MGQISVKIYAPTGSLLSGNLQPGQQIDERGTDTYVCQRQIIAAPFDFASQNFTIEVDGAVKVGHLDDDVIDSRDFHERLTATPMAIRQAHPLSVDAKVD
jgi:hypothetical protein